MDKKKMKEIWDVLTGDEANAQVSAALERRENNLSYLPWSDCWGILKGHFPASRYAVGETIFYPDDTAAVVTTLEIDGESQTERLAVMAGTRHTAVKNPDARQIGDSEKRCLVKTAALFGLGLWVYRGEDVPPKAKEPEPKAKARAKAPAKAKAKAKAGNGDVAREIRKAVTNIAASKTVDRLFPAGMETSGTSGRVLAVCNTANGCHTVEELKEHFKEVTTLEHVPEKEKQFANEIFKKERDRINATD